MQLTKSITERFYVPNDPDEAWVEIKHLKINEVKKIQGKSNALSFTSDMQGNGKTKLDLNPYNTAAMMAHASLVDWGGMKDITGKPLEFNKQNIDTAAEFELTIKDPDTGKTIDIDFYSWIAKIRRELADKVREQKKAAEEN